MTVRSTASCDESSGGLTAGGGPCDAEHAVFAPTGRVRPPAIMTELADLTSDVPYRQGPTGAARPARPAPGRRRRAADALAVNRPVDELDA